MKKLGEMRRFINEYVAATGDDRRSFLGLELPQTPLHPTVTIPIDHVVKFRNGYRLLLEFAALQCGRPIEELCPLDLIAPFLPMSEPDPEEEYF